MAPHELKAARLKKGLVQAQAAQSLGVSQSYVNLLENGKRRLTPELARRVATLYDLSPETLPVPEEFVPTHANDQRLAEFLAKLGYPGFAYMRTHLPKKSPHEVLLTALGQDRLEARVAEALPWVVMHYGHGRSNWLVEQARKFNLQNRLGFVVSLALQVVERVSGSGQESARVQSLRELRSKLDESRLVKEDVFYRPPRTDSEKQWLVQNRSEEAMHWNLLTDLRPEHLQYAS